MFLSSLLSSFSFFIVIFFILFWTDLPSVVKDVKFNENRNTMLAVCALKSGSTVMLDLSEKDRSSDLLFEMHGCGAETKAVICSDTMLAVGSVDGRISLVPHPLVHLPKFVECDWIAMFRHRPHLLLQPCCIDDSIVEDDNSVDDESSSSSWGLNRKAKDLHKSMKKQLNSSLNMLGSDSSKNSNTLNPANPFNVTTPLHLMPHASMRKLIDVLPPCHTTAICSNGIRVSLLDHIFNNREHEKCMIIAKVYPIERADNKCGEAFADWLVRLCNVYDDVIALAIETGVVDAPGALPKEVSFFL